MVKDEQILTLVPSVDAEGNVHPFGGGATVDNLLTSNPHIVDESTLEAQMLWWMNQGQAMDCVNSGAIGDLKGVVEKACSAYPCTYQERQAVDAALLILNRLEKNHALAQAFFKSLK